MLWNFITYFLTVFVVVLVPVYWHYYGWQNFLWLSDIGLFLTVIAFWAHSPLILSIAAVGVLAVELFWNIDFYIQLIFKKRISGLSDYMFNRKYSLWLRLLSLFHVLLPIIWLYYIKEWGYDVRAPYYFLPGYWMTLLCVYWFTSPKENINWVFQSSRIPAFLWVCILSIAFPVLIVLPTHYILRLL